MEGVQHPAITRKDKRGNKTVFKTLLKTILTAFMGCGAVMLIHEAFMLSQPITARLSPFSQSHAQNSGLRCSPARRCRPARAEGRGALAC
ncbi:hypothetical protein DSG95_10475 [Salmonella enterica subsp. enterica]|nr:hypothetical protein [Salmonella enterica subsp. enterica]EDF5355944.1 hypothetical protein [Salmonella enterica]EDG5068330.1 hypothetical protein [Salmonella enterica subsp. enterica serovar Derby]EEE1579620.1 hypothetical protein [Salmonella enterica subsp. enterica serovar 4,[5],12:i:-]EEV5941674.1 hypothetical protein [Escherichia coli]